MFPRVKRVRHICDYRLELTFADGAMAELDFGNKWPAAGECFVSWRHRVLQGGSGGPRGGDNRLA